MADYYAVCWLDKKNYSVRNKIAGWTVHESADEADGMTNIHIEATKYYTYVVTVHDELNFDRTLFKEKLCRGYFFTEEKEPRWFSGSKKIDKVHIPKRN